MSDICPKCGNDRNYAHERDGTHMCWCVDDDPKPAKLVFDSEGPGVVSSSCEFCGQTYYIDPENYQVAHELPMCPEFEAIEPLEFVIKNREIKQSKLNKYGAN